MFAGMRHKAVLVLGCMLIALALAACNHGTSELVKSGLAYLDLGQCERAIQDLGEAIRLDPQYAKSYYNRGLAYEQLRRLRSNPTHGRSGRLHEPGLKVVALADVNGVGRKTGREDVRCHSG